MDLVDFQLSQFPGLSFLLVTISVYPSYTLEFLSFNDFVIIVYGVILLTFSEQITP